MPFFKCTKQYRKNRQSCYESKALQNTGGENPNRKISVYLPPNYESTKEHFPVIYYLHGFMGKDSIFANMKTFWTKAFVSIKFVRLF